MCCTKLIIGLSGIYAIINQVDAISEIHDNNKKSVNVLRANSVSGIDDENFILPNKFILYQSFPNQFSSSTTIKNSIPFSDIVNIKVYDVLGKEVAKLMNEYKPVST